MRAGAPAAALAAAILSCGPGARPPGAPAGPPADGTCGSPFPLEPGASWSGTTLGRQASMTARCGAGAAGPEVVHSVVLDAPSRVLVDLSTPSHDGALHVRSGCGNGSIEVACNEDAGGPGRSLLWAHLDPGTWLVIADGSGPDDAGPYSLEVTVRPDGSAGPPWDECEGALAMDVAAGPAGGAAGSATIEGSTFPAGDDAWPPCSSSPGGPDLFFYVDLPAEADVKAEVTAADYPAPVVALAGGCGGDWSGCGIGTVVARLPRGRVVVLVDSLGADLLGAFTLSVSWSNPG